ncbi:MAG: glycosyltransferase [Tetrasphaera sp.]|jgi:glycosyltransferase involved in cell wall biosynthesis|nr:glycosyltransferase [Tetrasphaera sp.]
MGRNTLAVVATSPYQIALFLRGHLAALPPEIDVIVFSNTEDQYRDLIGDQPARHVPLSRSGTITPDDGRSGLVLARALRAERVRTLVTISPKAGFVGQLAGRAAGIPRRLHIFTGQVWESLDSGPKRWAAMAADRSIARSATHIAADSPSQAENLKFMGIVPRGLRIDVPNPAGSIRGVDVDVFRPRPDLRVSLRSQYGVDTDAVVFIHLGRISKAKGIPELISAFTRLRKAWRTGSAAREPRLFLVGSEEDDSATGQHGADGVTVLPFTPHPEEILAAMDVLVLASHREGFGSTIIEAGAVGLPAVGTDIVGVRDAIIPGETGWLVSRRDPDALYAALAAILRDPDVVRRRGIAAQSRARSVFGADRVTRAWTEYLLAIHGSGRRW